MQCEGEGHQPRSLHEVDWDANAQPIQRLEQDTVPKLPHGPLEAIHHPRTTRRNGQIPMAHGVPAARVARICVSWTKQEVLAVHLYRCLVLWIHRHFFCLEMERTLQKAHTVQCCYEMSWPVHSQVQNGPDHSPGERHTTATMQTWRLVMCW